MKVRYTKWGGRPHWRFDVRHLGRDEHGLWFGGAAGIEHRKGDEPPVTTLHDFVMLVPRAGCYVAFWNADDPVEVYVDVTTRPSVDNGVLAAADLDVDVIRLRSGEVRVVDEDEFALHQVRFEYPRWLVEQARATTDWLVAEVTARREPFDRVGPGWLARFQRLLVDVADDEEHRA